MMNKIYRVIFVTVFFMMAFSRSSFSQYAVGDYITICNGTGPTWNWAGSTSGNETWAIVDAVSPLAYHTVSTNPVSTTNAFVRSGHTVNVNAPGPYECKSMTVESGGKIWTTNNAVDVYVEVFGTSLICDGQIGDGITFDGLSLTFEGASCTVTGSGSFDVSRIRKNRTVAPAGASTTTNVTFSRNINLHFGATGAAIYNNSATSTIPTVFNVTVSAGDTLTLTSTSASAAIDSVAGNGGALHGGTFTINGAMIIPGRLYLITNNNATAQKCKWVVGPGGYLKANRIVAGPANGIARDSLIVDSLGTFEISGDSAWISIVSGANNVYAFASGSTVIYSSSSPTGNQVVRGNSGPTDLGAVVANAYGNSYGNLILSGAGTKSATTNIRLKNDLTISSPVKFAPNTGSTNQIGGNWINYNDTGYTETTATWRFNGATNQTITTPGGEVFYTIDYRKTADTLIFNSPVDVINQLFWSTDGLIDLNSNTLTIRNTATTGIQNPSALRYMISEKTDNSSKIKWKIGTTGAANQTYVFPFGTYSGSYIPDIVKVVTSGTPMGDITISTYGTPPGNTPLPTIPVLVTNLNKKFGIPGQNDSDAVVNRFWQVDATGGASAIADLSLTYAPAELPVPPYNVASEIVGEWYSPGTNSWQWPPLGTAAGSTVNISGNNHYGPWALVNTNSPLDGISTSNCLVAYYPFTGNAIDSSGNGNNGTVNGATLTADRFGNPNSAYEFTGASQNITTNYPCVSGTDARTFSLWFKQSSLNNGSNEWPLFSYGGVTQGSGFGVQIFPANISASSNRIGIDIGNSYVTYNPIPTLNQWHHLAVTYSSSFGNNVLACKIYLDNVLLNAIATQYNSSLTLNTGTGTNLYIGGNPNFTPAQFIGAIDDIRIYNCVLSDSAINALYQICTTPPVINLSDSTFVCGTSTNLNAGTGATGFLWSNGSTTQNIMVTQSGWYKCTVSNGSCFASDSTYLSLLNPNIVQNDTTICAGSSILLTASTSGVNQSCNSSGLPPGLQNGLVAYYPFCGNANDASGNGYNGIVNGATMTTDRFGKVNSAYNFDGSNYINTPLTQTNISEYTICAWIKTNVVNNNNFPLGLIQARGTESSGGIGITMAYSNFGRFKFIVDGNTTEIGRNSDINFNDNTWHFLAGTLLSNPGTEITASQIILYLDGVPVSSTISNSTPGILSPISGAGTLKIGFHEAWDTYFIGDIDDIFIFNRALSSAEIQQLYSIGNLTYSWSTGDTTSSINVTPTQTTTYFLNLTQNGHSCTDSVLINVNPTYSNSVNASICQGSLYILPNGQVITSAGSYTTTLQTIAGCDSVIITNLIVNANYSSNVSASICQGSSYTLPNGQVVNTSGNYSSTLHTTAGCDSMIITNLIVNPTYSSNVSASICQGNSYTLPNGQVVNTSGNYSSTLHTIAGCDSLIITNLILNPTYNSNVSASICQGSSYTLPSGQVVNTSGNYSSALHTAFGCDSVIITNLTVHPLPSATIIASGSTTICAGDSVTLTANNASSWVWTNGATTQSISAHTAGNYRVTVTDGFGCSALSAIKTITVNNNCPVRLSLKVFIEGFYIGGGVMQATVNPNDYPDLCDIITVELHQPFSPYDVAFSYTSTISTSGIGNFIFPHLALGNSYYIAVKQRNSNETWSKYPVVFNSTMVSFDFTSP